MSAKFTDGADTFVCQGTPKTFSVSIENGSTPYTYLWSTGDTTTTAVASLPDSVLIDEVSVTVKTSAVVLPIVKPLYCKDLDQ